MTPTVAAEIDIRGELDGERAPPTEPEKELRKKTRGFVREAEKPGTHRGGRAPAPPGEPAARVFPIRAVRRARGSTGGAPDEIVDLDRDAASA